MTIKLEHQRPLILPKRAELIWYRSKLLGKNCPKVDARSRRLIGLGVIIGVERDNGAHIAWVVDPLGEYKRFTVVAERLHERLANTYLEEV